MPELTDHELLADFARSESEAAFATLVGRYVNLVYSTALRFTSNSHHAEEITQAVFIILARKAGSISSRVVLSGWLYQSTRLTAANFVKGEVRRQRREQESYMQSTLNDPGSENWQQIGPLLEHAMGHLGETDRNAVLLRFFENKTAAEVASTLNLTEAAAQKRTNRALDKLRRFFSKHGVSSTTSIIAGAISEHSIHTAPAAVLKSVTLVATAKGAVAGGSLLTLVKGALKIMAWTNAKTTIVIGASVLLAAGTATVTVKTIKAHSTPIWQEKYDVSLLDSLPPQVAIRPSLPATVSSGNHAAALVRGNRGIGWGQSVKEIFMAAYGYRFHLAQLSFSTPAPGGKYDYISNLPHNPQEALQQELKRQFGLIGHLETNEVDCLILRVKTRNASGLKRSTLPFSGSQQDDSYSGHGQRLWALIDYLADHLGIVVIDQTKLTGSYDVDFKWDKTPDGLKQALLEQTGLELVPGKEPVEFLVIEDMNHR